MVQLAAVKNRASTALASLAMTMTAPSAEYFAARFDVGCGGIRIGLREVGRVPRLPGLRKQLWCTRDKAAGYVDFTPRVRKQSARLQSEW